MKRLPCDQNQHHNPAYKCIASSIHISSSHKVINPVTENSSINLASTHQDNMKLRYYSKKQTISNEETTKHVLESSENK